MRNAIIRTNCDLETYGWFHEKETYELDLMNLETETEFLANLVLRLNSTF